MALHWTKKPVRGPCHHDCPLSNLIPPPVPPPPLRPISEPKPQEKPENTSTFVILMLCVFGTAFIVATCLTYFKKRYSNTVNPSTNPPTFDDENDQDNFVDENHGPVLDHPIWYINTVGLQQSIIDSISVFKYKKDEALIEGTNCSICLSQFEEDETLRLLPKCSHAFHVPCIDTWLRSHKNCPLCRAPIVSNSSNALVSDPELGLNQLGRMEETRVENSGNLGGATDESRIGRLSFRGLPSDEERVSGILRKGSRNLRMKKNHGFRVGSDLANHRRKVEEELQAARRSVSMDALSASRIYLAVASVPRVETEGCSSNQLGQVIKNPSPGNINLSIGRLVKSASIGCSLQEGPVLMKRSFSSHGKFSLPRRHSRSQDSILPL